MNLIRKLWDMEGFRYLFFGGCATVVNVVTYAILTDICEIYYQTANVISWVITVLFAFFTNKYVVFQTGHSGNTYQELIRFYGARLLTLLLELFFMWLLIEQLLIHNLVSKCIVQIIVILSNYGFSKLYIFKGGNAHG